MRRGTSRSTCSAWPIVGQFGFDGSTRHANMSAKSSKHCLQTQWYRAPSLVVVRRRVSLGEDAGLRVGIRPELRPAERAVVVIPRITPRDARLPPERGTMEVVLLACEPPVVTLAGHATMLVEQRRDLSERPDVIRDACGHRWRSVSHLGLRFKPTHDRLAESRPTALRTCVREMEGRHAAAQSKTYTRVRAGTGVRARALGAVSACACHPHTLADAKSSEIAERASWPPRRAA